MKSFTDLGLSSRMVEACEKTLVWFIPTKIQTEVIPAALQGKDVFAISPSRSGKVGAFVLPILHALLEAGPDLNTFFACVVSPNWNLASPIAEFFYGLGSQFGVNCAFLVGDTVHQSKRIPGQPHIIVGDPRQIFNQLRDNQEFSLGFQRFQYLVIDDAHLYTDRSEQQLYDILAMIPSERTTFLFSTTLTEKVHTIQSVCLRNPVKIEVSSKYVDTMRQQHCSMLTKHKGCYLAYTLAEMSGGTSMVFTASCDTALLLALILKNLGFRAIPIIIIMSQAKKLESLNAFKSGECNILLCSDMASRGLDIPAVDMVINYDFPMDSKGYMYRMGWTHADVAISFVTPREEKEFKMIQKIIGFALSVYPAPHEDVLLWERRVSEAEILAHKEMKDFGWKSGGYLDQEEVHKIKGFGQRVM